jgi:hypothetical protein
VTAALSPLARIVVDVLRIGASTTKELASETKLPVGVVEAALAELRGAGRGARDRDRAGQVQGIARAMGGP